MNPALSPKNLWSLLKDSATAWSEDFAPSMGAAIAYYTAFSIAPLLIIVIAIAGFFFGREAASGQIYAQLGGLLGDSGAHAIQGMVDSASDTGEGVVASIVGIVLLLMGATTVFAELQTDLDRIWKAPAAKKEEGIWAMIRARLLSLGMVVTIGFILLVSLVISAVLSALGTWWGGVFGNAEWLLHLLNFIVSLAVITLLFALMYKILPRVSIGWHDVWIGALATAVLFTIGKLLVGLYLGKSSVVSTFGAAGSLAVLLLWVYYSAQIFLLGAEFTWMYAHRYGSRQGQELPKTAKRLVASTREPRGSAPGAPSGGQPGGQPAPAPAGAPLQPATTAQLARRVVAPAPDVALRVGPRMPPPRQQGIAGLVRRHPGAITGLALVIGAIAGEILNVRQARAIGRPRGLRRLASDLMQLRRAKVDVRRGRAHVELRPRSRLLRMFTRA
jgi:membrane protein